MPLLWLLSDARNDAGLEDALARLPRRSGFVFRHYHLAPDKRVSRFAALADRARQFGHTVILSGTCEQARAMGADGIYGEVDRIGLPRPGVLRLATAHDAAELAAAERAQADGVFLSPVFPTRSHPGDAVLGVEGFHALAANARLPVIALGGMNARRAAELGWPRWGAIDGLA